MSCKQKATVSSEYGQNHQISCDTRLHYLRGSCKSLYLCRSLFHCSSVAGCSTRVDCRFYTCMRCTRHCRILGYSYLSWSNVNWNIFGSLAETASLLDSGRSTRCSSREYQSRTALCGWLVQVQGWSVKSKNKSASVLPSTTKVCVTTFSKAYILTLAREGLFTITYVSVLDELH